MRTLQEISKDLNESQKIADTVIETVPAPGRPGIIMAIRSAKENIKKLHQEYADALLVKSVVFFPVGDKEGQNKFAEIANKVGKSVVVDSNALYEYLTDRIEPSIGHHRAFSLNQLMAVNHALQDLCMELNIDKPKIPELKGSPFLPDHDSLVQYIKHLVVESNGYRITIAYLRDLIYKKALAGNFSNKVLTVVATNSIGQDQVNLLGLFTKSVIINTNQEVTEEFVTKSIKEAFKK